MKLQDYFIIIIFIIIIQNLNSSKSLSICNLFKNQIWQFAGTNCGKFCADLKRKGPINCPLWRRHLGCFCKDGYYRDSRLNCVIPADCDAFERPTSPDGADNCPEWEKYDTCSSRCLEQCKNLDDPLACPIHCDRGCFCNLSNYLRDDFGKCVHKDKCKAGKSARSYQTNGKEENDQMLKVESDDMLEEGQEAEQDLLLQASGGKTKKARKDKKVLSQIANKKKINKASSETGDPGAIRSFSIITDSPDVPNIESPSTAANITCPEGERYIECGNRCKELCDNVRETFGSSLNCKTCQVGCFCVNEQLRNEMGTCIPKFACDWKDKFKQMFPDLFKEYAIESEAQAQHDE